ncbi:MAG: hypothetical protein NVSMB6_18860 [Burkholderiaceae bacterium]
MQEYETIKSARAMLAASRASTPPSERTVAGYVTKARLIVLRAGKGAGIEQLMAQAKNTRSASTWFSRRAALMHSFRRAVDQLLAEQDTMQRAIKAAQLLGRSPDLAAWQNTVKDIGKMTAWHERLREEPGPAVEERKPRHSKRGDLRGLPHDWREILVARMPKYKLAALTNAVTGCRPDELLSGVQLEIRDGHLLATIKGSKCTTTTGQPWRRLFWPVDSESPLVRALVAEVHAGASLAQIADTKAYSGAMRAAGYRAWPRRKKTKKTVTPYCMRHALAADMKASGIGAAEISAGLGHCSDVTKQYYGSASQGGGTGSVAPAKVEASREVRITPTSKYISPRSSDLPHFPDIRE